MQTIYQPKGRAREYSPLALNLYTGCGHHCTYCYARMISKRFGVTEKKFNTPQPRLRLIENLEKRAYQMKRDRREINLCFMCDPYSIPEGNDITTQALEILQKNKLNVSILTKAGTAACRDFDILARNMWKFGSTITCFGEVRKKHEPNAAKMSDRIDAIVTAKKMGIFTWVSLEPVFDVDQALEILHWGKNIVDFWKIGKINYHPEIEKRIDWRDFFQKAFKLIGCKPHMIKRDLFMAALKNER